MNALRLRRAAIPLASLLALLSPGASWAQPASPAPAETAPTAPAAADAPPAGEGTQDAAQGTPPAPAAAPAPAKPAPIAADPAQLEKAKGHFKQGIAFAQSGDCSAAIVEFQAAYAIIPRPNMLYNIAQCQERLFRYDLAVRYYEQYLQEAPADAADRGAVQAALKTLGNLLGTVIVSSNVPAEVWVGERLAGEAPGEVLLPAGGHTLELRADGYIPTRKEVSIVGHDRIAIEFKLTKAQTTIEVTETTGLSPVLFWSGVGATTAATIVGGIFALQAKNRFDDADALDPYDPKRASAKTDIESSEFNADLSFAIAGVLGVGTVIVGFLTDWDGERPPRADSPPPGTEALGSLQVKPLVSRTQLGLQVGGAL